MFLELNKNLTVEGHDYGDGQATVYSGVKAVGYVASEAILSFIVAPILAVGVGAISNTVDLCYTIAEKIREKDDSRRLPESKLTELNPEVLS